METTLALVVNLRTIFGNAWLHNYHLSCPDKACRSTLNTRHSQNWVKDRGDQKMNVRIFIWIFWPAFMSALIAEGVFFSLIHPADLVFFNHANTLSSEAIYSIGFIFFWLLGALSSALTFYIRGDLQKTA